MMGAHILCNCNNPGCAICIWKVLPGVDIETENERLEINRLHRLLDGMLFDETETLSFSDSSIATLPEGEPPGHVIFIDDQRSETSTVHNRTDGGDHGRGNDDNGPSVRHDEEHESRGEEECIEGN